jgi:phospholipid/cholesterol/gamma-HCH transport system ATP-binding protein
LIHVRGLTKRVVQPGKKPRTLLEGIDLQIEAGTLFGLIGPGASGKSVLLKMLTGLMRPDTGEVSIEGEDITKASELRLQEIRKRIGMLFQNNALFDHMTVGENIAFPLRRLFALPESEIESRIAERLDCVALSGFQARMPSGLSGGQKKRVGVARATVTRAPIVFYDEPAAGLDPVTSQKIFDLLRKEQRAAGATVVMVSSDLDRLLTVTDRVGMLHRGQLVFQGTTEEAKTTMDPLVRQFVHGLGEGPL